MSFRVSDTALGSTVPHSTPPRAVDQFGPCSPDTVSSERARRIENPAAELGGAYAAAFEREVIGFRRLTRDDEAALSYAVQRAFRLPRLLGAGDGGRRSKKKGKAGQELTPTFEELAGQVDMNDPKVRRIFAQGLRARDALVTANLRLVLGYVGKLRGPDVIPGDLVQEGVVGLIRAAEKYDPSTGFAFSTYAYSWIRSRVGHAIRRQESLVRVPDHSNLLIKAIQRAQQAAKVADGSDRELTSVELAQILDVDEKKVRAVLMRVPMAKGFVPMDHPGLQGLEISDRRGGRISPTSGSPDDVNAQPGGPAYSIGASSAAAGIESAAMFNRRGSAGPESSALAALSDYGGGVQTLEQREQTAALLSLLRAVLSQDEFDALVTRFNLGPPAPYAQARRALRQQEQRRGQPLLQPGLERACLHGDAGEGSAVGEDHPVDEEDPVEGVASSGTRHTPRRRRGKTLVTASGVRPYVEVARLTNLSLHQSRYAVKSSLAKLRSEAVKDALRPFFEE